MLAEAWTLIKMSKIKSSSFANASEDKQKSKIISGGFTIMELLVAVFILAVGVTGMIALINKLVISGTAIQQQLVAAGLAQEGIEIIHNIRNTNWIQNESWSEGLEQVGCRPSPLENVGCPINAAVVFNSTSININNDPAAWELEWNGSNYVHSSGGVFSRHVEISYKSDTDGDIFMEIKSVVDWRGKSFEVLERLYDWK